MVLQDGVFYVDLYFGNIIYLCDGWIGVIDFGMVGVLFEQCCFQVVQLLYGLVIQEFELVMDVLLDWVGGVDVDEVCLQQDISIFVDQYCGVLLKDLYMGLMLGDVMQFLCQYVLILLVDFVLMIKIFLILEGMGCQFDLQFDMVIVVCLYLEWVMWQCYVLVVMFKCGKCSLFGVMDLMGDLLCDVCWLLQMVCNGCFQVKVEICVLEGFGDQVNWVVNWLVMGIVMVVLIIGFLIVMYSVGGVFSCWLLVLGVVGFVGVGFCGVWILFLIWCFGCNF